MREAVIVSTARTPIGRAYKGAFNDTHGATIGGHVIAHAVSRAGLYPAEVEDVILGCALQQGATGGNIARQAAVRAGLPVTTAGTTVDRQCSSGLQAIAIATQRVTMDGLPVAVGGGLESISLVQNEHINRYRGAEDWLVANKPDIYMAMIDTAEVVAQRYQITRAAQDEYALESQRRTAAAQAAWSQTSKARACAARPCWRSPSRAACRRSAWRALSTTVAPDCASARASARPMPVEAPVTRATRPSSRKVWASIMERRSPVAGRWMRRWPQARRRYPG